MAKQNESNNCKERYKMNQKPRIFILQSQSRYDISAVKYYSKELVYIIKQERINPFDINDFTELVKHRLIMENFNPEIDFICLTGSSVLLSLFLAIIVRKYTYCSQFKILIFDAATNKYKLRMLNFGGD